MLKRNTIGIDANPLACLISECKTTRFEQVDRDALIELVKKSKLLSETISVHDGSYLFNIKPFVSKALRPQEKAISFWFEPFVVEELAEILSWCKSLPTSISRKVALTAFSSIIVNVSKQDSDTRYVRRNKKIAPGETVKKFYRALEEAIRVIDEFTELVEPRFKCEINKFDILSKPKISEIDLVVCSPPYPNAYSYHLYHMTRMVWLGMDQPKFKKEEIGSHRKYSAKGKNGITIDTFKKEMTTIFEWLSEHLKAKKFACFVIGDSTIGGKKFNNANLLSEVAMEANFKEVGRIERNISGIKKAFNPTIGKIKTEHILLLRNDREIWV